MSSLGRSGWSRLTREQSISIPMPVSSHAQISLHVLKTWSPPMGRYLSRVILVIQANVFLVEDQLANWASLTCILHARRIIVTVGNPSFPNFIGGFRLLNFFLFFFPFFPPLALPVPIWAGGPSFFNLTLDPLLRLRILLLPLEPSAPTTPGVPTIRSKPLHRPPFFKASLLLLMAICFPEA